MNASKRLAASALITMAVALGGLSTSEAAAEMENSCNSGGPGASYCSYTIAEHVSCSVTCADSYYACWSITDGCHCIPA